MNTETKQTSWFARHKILTGIGIFFIVGAVANALDPVEPQPKAETATVTEEVVEEIEVIKVNANSLLKEYDANQVSASVKYEGKLLEISGLISDIGTDIRGESYVKLADTVDAFNGVQCFFTEQNKESITTLTKGSTATLQGTPTREVIGNIIVEDCQIVQ